VARLHVCRAAIQGEKKKALEKEKQALCSTSSKAPKPKIRTKLSQNCSPITRHHSTHPIPSHRFAQR
jgi:hypothetical protein